MKTSTDYFAPIENSNKISRVVRAIQDYVIEGNLEQGTELPPERELASKLGVSRFSVREALRVAEAQGLIEITRGRPPRVANPSPTAAANIIALTLRRSRKTLLDLIAARKALETEIASIAAVRAAGSDINKMQETIDAIKQNTNDLELCVEQDMLFHQLLVGTTGNLVFEIMLAPLSNLLRDSRKETIRQGVDHVIHGHEAILDAVAKGDGATARQAMLQHLQLAESDLQSGSQSTDES